MRKSVVGRQVVEAARAGDRGARNLETQVLAKEADDTVEERLGGVVAIHVGVGDDLAVGVPADLDRVRRR